MPRDTPTGTPTPTRAATFTPTGNTVRVGTVFTHPGATAVAVRLCAVTDQPLTLFNSVVGFDGQLCSSLDDSWVEKTGRTTVDPQENVPPCSPSPVVHVTFLDITGAEVIPLGRGDIAKWMFDVSPTAACPMDVPLTLTIDGASNGPVPVAISPIGGRLSIRCGAICLLDVDQSGCPADVATDVVYIARTLLGLVPVPPSFGPQNPSIPPNVASIGDGLDVDRNCTVDVATDIIYIARYMLGLPPVPASFRLLDPTIPPDAIIAANIRALCGCFNPGETATPTVTPTHTPSETPTDTPTQTATNTPTAPPTATATSACDGACPGTLVDVTTAVGVTSPRPRVKADADGNAVIVWRDHGSGTDEIYWTKVDRFGMKLTPDQSLTAGTFPATQPDHGVDAAGNIYLAFQTGSDIRLAGAAADGTRLWNGTTVRLCTSCSNPSVVSEANGRTHIVYEQNISGVPPFRVYYANVTFDAVTATWTTATVSSSDILGVTKTPFIDLAGDGARFISWHDYDWTYNYGVWEMSVTGTNTLGTAHRFNHGNNVDKPVVRYFRFPSMNFFWFLFENNTGAGRQIYSATDIDQAYAVSQGAGPATNPRIANRAGANGDLLAVVWEDARSGVKRIYSRRLYFTGSLTTWPEVSLSAPGDEAISPDIAAGTHGDFHVVWAQGPAGNRHIYWTRLTQ